MTDYIERALSQEVLAMAEQYPVVTLTGPRQSGKTALVQRLFPEKPSLAIDLGGVFYHLSPPTLS